MPSCKAFAPPSLEIAMPHDLVHFGVLKQKKAMSAADFEKALSTKKRLGPYLN
mgnify:CR=1 FL=1